MVADVSLSRGRLVLVQVISHNLYPLYEVLTEYQEIESGRGQFKLLVQKMVTIKEGKRHSGQELTRNAYD